MNTRIHEKGPTSLAASVAPEDLQCRDYVAVLNVIHEFPSFLWCCDATAVSPDQPVRVQCVAPDGGIPLRVKAICLPFVFLKTPDGRSHTVDLRQVQLVRLHPGYAKLVWKELRRQKNARDTPVDLMF